MISIIDYGMGNLRSVQKAFERMDIKAKIISNPHDLRNADKILLPGVGHFENGITNLKELGFVDALKEEIIVKKKPILGICLGMQLMTSFSEEGNFEGLNFIEAQTQKFVLNTLKIPHMGWNSIEIKKNSIFSNELNPDDLVYFVHSYFVRCKNDSDVLFKTNYGISFDSAFEKDNIIGFQFHPEKSHKTGLNLLKKFVIL